MQFKQCPRCNGKGTVRLENHDGILEQFKCTRCGGRGSYVPKRKEQTVDELLKIATQLKKTSRRVELLISELCVEQEDVNEQF